LRGLVRDAEDENQDVYPDAREEDFGEPLEKNVLKLEIKIDNYERWCEGASNCSNKRFCGNSSATGKGEGLLRVRLLILRRKKNIFR
jgi:hypothetical protein